jgi:HK97 family phage major capsid protein
MLKIAQMLQERALKSKAQEDLVKARKEGDGKFTEEQRTQFATLQTEIEALDVDIAEERQIEKFEKEAAKKKGERQGGTKEKGEDAEKKEINQRASISKAFRSKKALDGAEKELNEIGIQANRDAGVETNDDARFTLPMSALREQSVTGNNGDKGGQFVIDQTPRVQMPFQPATFLESLGATRLSNLTGGSIPLPVGQKFTMQWLAENAKITTQANDFKGPQLKPERLGGAVDISRRLIVQSSVDAENIIRQLLLMAYESTLGGAAINGSGNSNEPEGILNKDGIKLSANTEATDAEWKQITELMGLIDGDDATEVSRAYLMSPQLRAALMSTMKDAGSGRFVMENRNDLNGYNAGATSLVPVLSGNQVLIYGDFSKLFIGEWGAISLLEDPYSASLENSIRIVVNATAGVEIAQPNAFAANKFIKI